MQNPLLKNRKTGLHHDIAHRTSHYNRVLAAKSFYKGPQYHIKNNIISSLNSKRHQSLEEQRKFNNKKLINKMIQIDKKYKNKDIGNYQQYKSPKSLKNQFIVKEQLNKIMQENKVLYQKISHITSEVGSRKQWKQRNKKNKYYSDLKNNNNRLTYTQLDQTFFNTFNKLRFKNGSKSYIKYQRNLSNRLTKKQLRKKFSTQPIVDGQTVI